MPGGPSNGRRRIALSTRRSIGRLIDTLPPPRNEALKAVLQSTLDLIRGRKPTYGRSGPDGRSEAIAVEQGWLVVDAYERMGTDQARRVFAHEIDAWVNYARTTITDLRHPKHAGSFEVLENDANRQRHRRIADFVQRGDRVFDVGVGRGYQGVLLLRDREIEAYFGIDIEPRYLEAARQLAESNDLDISKFIVSVGDLYQLKPEDIAATRADLVLCFEVLEHVSDPEKALTTIARALPSSADLIFSVPLNKRLESVWGHLAVFDVARLKSMIALAGLRVHHVEPLANTWTFVIASKKPAPSKRVQQSSARAVHNVSTRLNEKNQFVQIESSDLAISPGSSSDCSLEEGEVGRVICRLSGQGDSITFPVQGLSSLRFELGYLDLDYVTAIHVDAHQKGRRVARWTMQPVNGASQRGSYKRFAVGPERSSTVFKTVHVNAGASIDRVDVVLENPLGHESAFSFRAAYLP